METKASRSLSLSGHRGVTRPGLPTDWQPASGLVDRMLAYREWWNIPEGSAGRGAARPGAAKNRIRPQEPAG